MNYLSGSFGAYGYGGGSAGGVGSGVFGLQGRVQVLQAQLFPVCPVTGQGFLSSFISKGLKTNQLEVNTDEKTLRPVARLKEPRDLFALPKDKDNDCSQQAARWPIECQVLDERINHVPYNPNIPEPYNVPNGLEPKPRPVGEENGIVVFNYNPVSAVNYGKCKLKNYDTEASDSDSSSSESRASSPDQRQKNLKNRFAKMFKDCRSSSNSNDDDNDDDDDDEEDEDEELLRLNSLATPKPCPVKIEGKEIEDIWGNNSPPFSTSPIKTMINRVKVKQLQQETINPMPVVQTARLEIFSRSSVGGSKYLSQVHPFDPNEYEGLWFESRFESGNLAKAVKVTDSYYELYLRPDLYTSRSKQWFYFRVSRTKANMSYRFSIVNLVKSDSLYNDGMRPLMYSELSAARFKKGWSRCGENICYYRNDDESSADDDDENCSYTLTFNVEFPHDDDVVYFAHSYPYTYSDLQDYLMEIQKHPVKSKFCKLRLLCRSLAGNNVYYLTVTSPSTEADILKKKKAIVVSARVHPSETPSSWMMKGLMDFITSESIVAKRLRHKFIFKLVPMLNPDGVIVGNTRNSLTGKDLNRQYRTVIRETYPSIWYTKAMIKRLIEECGVAMYCDMHAHSRRQNIFVYGCENRRNPEKKLTEQVFPLMMHKNVADKFSFENCKFKIQRSKEGTGRIVVWMLGVTNSYTIEASFGGSSLGSRKGTHFSTGDYEQMGRAFCETLLDYCDENPNKERLRLKIIERLLKEGSSADEPLNIPLSDYSSDEGDTSSSSDNEGKADRFSDLEGPCCRPLRAPPCTPDAAAEKRKSRMKKHRSKSQYVVNRNMKKDQRIPLDMPTTDPGSDLFYSTDEDPYPEIDVGLFDTIPRSRRYLLHSDLQRRYIYTIGDGGYRMPPELIVTPADKQVATRRERRDTSADSGRRTGSWPYMSSNSARSLGRATGLKNNQHSGRSSNRDDPKDKLAPSLGQSDAYDVKRHKGRPLSWLLGPVPQKEKKQDDQKALLNACSKKLAQWQQEKESRGHRHSKLSINNIGERITSQKCNPSLREKRSLQYREVIHSGNNNSYMTKVSQNHYLLSKRSSGPNSSSNSTNALDPIPSTSIDTHRPSNKFKTGGIVATAVQPNKKGRQRSVAKPIALGTIDPLPTQTDNERSFARRVKTKLKKKKSVVSLKCKT